MAVQNLWKDGPTFETIKFFAYTNSIMINSETGLCNVSIAVKPSPFPRDQFEFVSRIQTNLNSILDTISRDHQFLVDTFSEIAKVDDFIKKLFDIYLQVTKQGYVQTTALGIHRCDYMVDYNSVTKHVDIKQVEMNTIASSLGPLCERLTDLHEFVISRYSLCPSDSTLPDNNCIVGMTNGLSAAWKEYNNQKAQVLFVVGSDEKNMFDQRMLEYHLWKCHGIKVVRKTLSEISLEGHLNDSRGLFIGDVEIAVVYYRGAYKPDDFPTEKEWSARLMLEMSRATNCPNLPYFFVGFKKVQQVMANPGVLERYCSDMQVISDIRKTFTGQYTLDQTPEGDKAVEMALQTPHKFVMKPQREGGGNNIYGEDIRTTLLKLGTSPSRGGYILMDRINPVPIPGVLWWSGHEGIVEYPVINELGILGVFVRKGDEVLLNTNAGHTVKTKPPANDEGGVGYGASVIDTPLLISTEHYLQQLINNFAS